MTSVLRCIFVVGALLTLASCATLTTGTTQDIRVQTDPAGATCRLTRDNAIVAQIDLTPRTIKVDKSTKPIAVTCTRQGFEETVEILISEFQAATVGNVIFGGLIGVAIDAGSGAMNKDPEAPTIIMVPSSFATAPDRDAFYASLVANARQRADEDIVGFRQEAICRNPTDAATCERNVKAREQLRDDEVERLEQKRGSAKVGTS